MKAVIVTIAMLMAGQVYADGFVCNTDSGDLKLQVYNYVNPKDGTRVPARMILSNPQNESGDRTLAVFNTDSGTLDVEAASSATSETTIVGKVDLRFSQLSAKDALVLGTRLADLATVSLALDFKYSDKLAKGDLVEALVVLTNRSGGEYKEQATCTRYKKGE